MDESERRAIAMQEAEELAAVQMAVLFQIVLVVIALLGFDPTAASASRFPLTNGHAGLDCLRCHQGGNFTNTSGACVSCHQAQYAATTSPPHAGRSASAARSSATSRWWARKASPCRPVG